MWQKNLFFSGYFTVGSRYSTFQHPPAQTSLCLHAEVSDVCVCVFVWVY